MPYRRTKKTSGEAMKRFVAYAIEPYYPSGFLGDVLHQTDTLEEMDEWLLSPKSYTYMPEWVYDTETGDEWECKYVTYKQAEELKGADVGHG